MNRYSRKIVGLIVFMLMLITFSTQSVFAATEIFLNANDSPTIGEIVERISNEVDPESGATDTISIKTKDAQAEGRTIAVFKYVGDELKLTFDEEAFAKADQKEAKKVLELFIDELRESSISSNNQQAIMTSIQESDSKVASMMIPLIFDNSQADLFSAYKIVYPFLQVLGVVLGIGAYIIILLLLGSTVVDLLYIGLPVWREKADSKGSSHPFGVSYEAMTTVKEVESGLTGNDGAYRNAYVIYFKRRALSYIVLAICILYLIAGQLGGIITFVLNLVSGFM